MPLTDGFIKRARYIYAAAANAPASGAGAGSAQNVPGASYFSRKVGANASSLAD